MRSGHRWLRRLGTSHPPLLSCYDNQHLTAATPPPRSLCARRVGLIFFVSCIFIFYSFIIFFFFFCIPISPRLLFPLFTSRRHVHIDNCPSHRVDYDNIIRPWGDCARPCSSSLARLGVIVYGSPAVADGITCAPAAVSVITPGRDGDCRGKLTRSQHVRAQSAFPSIRKQLTIRKKKK